ncbi:MAG TPA: hypothetical protein VKO87_09305 [Gemmatimonadaceae bacterium]|nr:hypothetical protein [Gemmatimonadaceae bacterium]
MTDPRSNPTDLNERERSSLPIEHYAENMTPVETIPPQEPLFNKKVMLLWALGALAVWFAISFVMPVVRQSAKEAIIQSVKEAEKQSGGHITIRRRDGSVISITETPAPAKSAPAATGATPAAAPSAATSGTPALPATPPAPKPPAAKR